MKLRKWYGNCKVVWANGARYDIDMLDHLFGMAKVGRPWGHGHVMCMRPIRWIASNGTFENPLKSIRNEAKHHPVSDARAQARFLQAVNQQLPLKGLAGHAGGSPHQLPG